MIKEYEVKVFEEHLYCDECGDEMFPTGNVLTSCPLQFPHECPSCGFTAVYTTPYPNKVYKRVEIGNNHGSNS